MAAKDVIIGFDHYSIAVKDLESSTHFYHHILGFELMDRPNFDFPGTWLRVGKNISLHLIEDSEMKPIEISGSRKLHFAFAVEDIYVVRNFLTGHNIAIVKPIKERPDGVLQMFVRDPDGYYVEFNQQLATGSK
jgi:catechol 2,3-dioxygenase-like lactoylglutathione lyase family enzyme